jgi:hypothetical protein
MKTLGAAGCLLLVLACSACAASDASADRGGSQASEFPVVTYTPSPGQPIPATLIQASPFRLGASVRAGYACFSMDGVPIAWPAGFSAVKEASGALEVRDKAGQLLRTGGTKLLGVMTVTSTGTACSSKGQNVTVVVSLPTST